MKKAILGIIILTIVIGGYFIYHINNYNTKSLIQNNDVYAQRDVAIQNYLLSQKDFAWETKAKSSHLCLFEYLESHNSPFPISLWVYCIEYIKNDGEIQKLSGISSPVLLDHHGEFKHTIPRDGSFYGKDIKEMFSKEAQENIFNRSVADELIKKSDKILKNEFHP